MSSSTTASRIRRAFAAAGALAAAFGVALAAIGTHALHDASAATRAATAASFLLWHGLALLMLAPRQRDRLELISLAMLLCGMALFCGPLALAAFFGVSTTLAPFGGSLLILGWLLQAVAALRR